MGLFCHSCKKEISFERGACNCELVTLWVSKEELYLDEAVIIAKQQEEVEKAIASVPACPTSLEWNENLFSDLDDFDDFDDFINVPEDNDGDVEEEDYSEFEQFMKELFG